MEILYYVSIPTSTTVDGNLDSPTKAIETVKLLLLSQKKKYIKKKILFLVKLKDDTSFCNFVMEFLGLVRTG